MPDCAVCHRPEADTPMVFKKDPWCCDNCRKEYERVVNDGADYDPTTGTADHE